MRLKFEESQIRSLADAYDGRDALDEIQVMGFRDEVLRLGYLSLDQLKAIAHWKSPRSCAHVEKNDAVFVREVTQFALGASNERARIEALTLLDGVQWPTASVILHLTHRDPYPILDFRALWSIDEGVPAAYSFPFWWRYVEFTRKLAIRNQVSMRLLDRALWQYSKQYQSAAPDGHGVPTLPSHSSRSDQESV